MIFCKYLHLKIYNPHRSCLIADERPGVEKVEGVNHIGVTDQNLFVKLPNLEIIVNNNDDDCK